MTIALVSGQTCGASAGSGANCDLVFPGNVTAGNLIVVAGGIAYNPTRTSVAGDLTQFSGTAILGTIQLDGEGTRSTNPSNQTPVWSVPVLTSGSLTLRIAGISGSLINAGAAEFSGMRLAADRVWNVVTSSVASGGTPKQIAVANQQSVGHALQIGSFGVFTPGCTYTPDAAYSTIYSEGGSAVLNASLALYEIFPVGVKTADLPEASCSTVSATGYAGTAVLYLPTAQEFPDGPASRKLLPQLVR